MLYNRGYPKLSKELFDKSEKIFNEMDDEEKEAELLEIQNFHKNQRFNFNLSNFW